IVLDRAGPAENLGRVRTVPVGPRERELTAERVHGDPAVAGITIGERIRVVESVVEPDRVLALILWILAALTQVCRALTEPRGRRRKRVQECDAVRRQTVRWNDV